jgi:hypothetical protein
MAETQDRLQREHEWLQREVAYAAGLTDRERIEILEDLWHTAEIIRATKTPEQLQRDERARQVLDSPGLVNYRALAARLA